MCDHYWKFFLEPPDFFILCDYCGERHDGEDAISVLVDMQEYIEELEDDS